MVSLKRINIEAEKIEVVKNLPKSKLGRNIQVFLGFDNFYRQFIQGFSRIAVPFTSILKTTGLSDKPAPSKNNGSKSASSKNNNSKLISGKNNGDGEIDGFGVDGNGVEHAKKSEKLSKLGKLSKPRKSKSKKTSKS